MFSISRDWLPSFFKQVRLLKHDISFGALFAYCVRRYNVLNSVKVAGWASVVKELFTRLTLPSYCNLSGAGNSKLTTSLVNVSFKFQT